MLQALGSAGPDPALADKLRLYGQFVGSWWLEIEHRPAGGAPRRAEGEWHFAWALDGRAVQDVWIWPSRRLRAEQPGCWTHGYGTTLRWYEPAIDAWRIVFIDPGRAVEVRQIGRAQGADIVQVGETASGLWRRWRFTEIGPRTFRWLGDVSWDRGASWSLEMEMRASRAD